MTDWPLDLAQLQLSPLGQWVALHGPELPVLDVSTPAGIVCRTVIEQGRDAVCVSPRRAVGDVLADQLGNRIEVKTGQLTALPLASASMGSVVAVNPDLDETLLDAAVDEFARVLDDSGLLVVALEVSVGSGSSRRGSRDLGGLQEAVSRRFAHLALTGMSHRVVTTLGQGALVPEASAPESDGAGMTVVVASNRPLPPIEGSFVALGPPQVDQWIREWQRLLADLRDAMARAATAPLGMAERDLVLGELLASEQRLAEAHDSKVQETKKRLREASERIALLKGSTDAAHARIRDLETSTSWRVTAPLRRLKSSVSRDPRS